MSKKDDKLKAAVWQYLVDHASVADDNMLRIKFHVHTEADFWQRVKARKNGTFMRRDQEQFEKRADVLRARRESHSGITKWRNKTLTRMYHGNSDERDRAKQITKLTLELDSLYEQQKRSDVSRREASLENNKATN